MITVAIANQKGGVGKSATTVCLAGCLVDRGYRVLVVDLEPQCTATEWLGLLSPSNRGDDLEDPFGPAVRKPVEFAEKLKLFKAMGFDEGFIRLWRFYLAACIAGFRTGRTDVMQVELTHA